MTNENVLVDDSEIPVIEIPIEKGEVKIESIASPLKKSNNELVIAIVLIVLVIGAYLLFNYLNKKKAQENG